MELIYFADPMCSWCWGFSPVMETVLERVSNRVPTRLVMGGLRPGTTEAMDEAMKASIREHWGHVQEASGQPFDFSFFERDGFVYDTEPAARAVVAVRELALDRAFSFLARVQGAFYRDNLDVSRANALADLAEEIGLGRDAFMTRFEDPSTRSATLADFEYSARIGVRGFPTLVADDGQRRLALTVGFQPADRLLPAVEAWLEDRS